MLAEEQIKLLKEYPPIIEIRVPEKYAYSSAFLSALHKQLKMLFGKDEKYLAIMMQAEKLPPVIILKETNPVANVHEFAKQWKEYVQVPAAIFVQTEENKQKFEKFSIDFVKIHSVLDIGIEKYNIIKQSISEFIVTEMKKDTN